MTFHVYTAFDADRRPLYVGQTGNLSQRMDNHRRYSGWFHDAALVAVIPFDTRAEAIEAEAWRIDKLRPLHNVQHNPRRETVAERIERYEWGQSFRLLNGSRADRHRWLELHPEATAADRKWIATQDLRESRRSA